MEPPSRTTSWSAERSQSPRRQPREPHQLCNTSYLRQWDGEDACLSTAKEEQTHRFKAHLIQKAIEEYSGVEDYMGVDGS
jgi:hypothetical protein